MPLSAVGMVLNYTGNHLLHHIHQVYRKRIFFPMHKVVGISLLCNGDIVTTAVRTEVSIECEESKAIRHGQTFSPVDGGGSTGNYKVNTHGSATVTFRSKAVILSNGGVQELNPDFFRWFPSLLSRR